MPISRGNSVFKSRWIQDFGKLLWTQSVPRGTPAPAGGLDSLLQPTGPLKKAQERAARAFGSQFTYFATNAPAPATRSFASLGGPQDMVLIDRDCIRAITTACAHRRIPGLLGQLSTARIQHVRSCPLENIREKLLELKRAGRLQHVKMLLLTNCTFDGVVYNVQRVMEQVLAIKPDMVFLWDEAWFAFAGFSYIFKQRTAMFSAARLHRKYHSEEYREVYTKQMGSLKKGKRLACRIRRRSVFACTPLRARTKHLPPCGRAA